MAILSNWIAVNRQRDTLPETQARTILNFIRSFTQYLADNGYQSVLQEFQQHLHNSANPHHVILDDSNIQIAPLLIDYLKASSQALLSDTTLENNSTRTSILTEDGFNEAVRLNPPLMVEIMRQYAANEQFSYEDGVGSFNSEVVNTTSQPFYQMDNPQPFSWTPPYYSSTVYLSDRALRNGVLTTALPTWANTQYIACIYPHFGSLDVYGVYQINFDVCNISIANSISGEVDITLTTSQSNYSTKTLNVAISPSLQDLRFALIVTPDHISLVYRNIGIQTTVTLTADSPATITNNTLSVSHGMWDCATDETATRTIELYNYLTDTEIERRLNVL